MRTRLVIFGAVLLILGLIAFVISQLPGWAWHPLGYCSGTPQAIAGCKGYNSWSGIVSDFGEISIVGGLATIVAGFWHRHNCHVHRCPRLQWHVHPDHGHPVCKSHHPHKVLSDGSVIGKGRAGHKSQR